MQGLQTAELSWGEKLVAQGLLEGMRKSVLLLLTSKFGELPSSFVNQLNTITDRELLSAIMIQVLTVQSLNEIKLTTTTA
jgi:hypothetical protein